MHFIPFFWLAYSANYRISSVKQEEFGGHPLQAGLENDQFAEKLKTDADLSKEVIRALFGMAEYDVNVKVRR